MNLSKEVKAAKLDELVEIEGFEGLDDMLELVLADSVSPAICVNPNRSYATEMEPDQSRGWCEECSTNTVVSAFVLTGLI